MHLLMLYNIYVASFPGLLTFSEKVGKPGNEANVYVYIIIIIYAFLYYTV